MDHINLSDKILLRCLHEDLGNGDVTTSALIPEQHVSKAEIVAKSDLVLSGLPFAERIFQLMDGKIRFSPLRKEGSKVKGRTVIAKVSGNTGNLLKAERTALNLLQRLSGIATLTSKYVQQVKGLNVKIADTRKTAPGLRYFDKYAVRVGGGHNHRFGLFDGVLIKDNHIAAAGGVGEAVRQSRARVHHLFKIEIEVKNVMEVKQALAAGADVIMLDNMDVIGMKKAVSIIRWNNSGIIIEASGNITLETVRCIAETGVDLISVGALTHSAPASDVSMKILS